MAAGEVRIGVRRRILNAVATLMPALLMGGACPGSVVGTALLAATVVSGSQPKLMYLQPGTLIGDKPPAGWSHLVVHSIPRLASGDQGTLPAGSSKTATYFRTVILANVTPVDSDEKEFELVQIGIGMCVPAPQDEEHDIVVAADRLDALGLHLSMVQRVVLDAAEAELAEGRIIARTPTFALFRSPATVVGPGNEHRKTNLYYAFCVERSTGKLEVAVWTMSPEAKSLRPPGALVRLGSNPRFDCQLDVRAKRILGTVPYSWSFALRTLPAGRTLRVAPPLGELIATIGRHPAEGDPEELERLLMKTMGATTDADKGVRRTAIPPPYRQPR
jgi:hypothetical protein